MLVRLSIEEFNKIRDIIFGKYYEKMLNDKISIIADEAYDNGFDEGYDAGYADGYMKAKKEDIHNEKNA